MEEHMKEGLKLRLKDRKSELCFSLSERTFVQFHLEINISIFQSAGFFGCLSSAVLFKILAMYPSSSC